MGDSEDFNKTIFNSLIWEELEKVKDDRILREFVTIAKNEIAIYESGGGSFPSIEYLIGLAQDKVREKEIKVKNEIEDKDKDRKELLNNTEEFKKLVRDSWIKKYNG